MARDLKRLLRLCPEVILTKREIQFLIDDNMNQIISEYKKKNKAVELVTECQHNNTDCTHNTFTLTTDTGSETVDLTHIEKPDTEKAFNEYNFD